MLKLLSTIETVDKFRPLTEFPATVGTCQKRSQHDSDDIGPFTAVPGTWPMLRGLGTE